MTTRKHTGAVLAIDPSIRRMGWAWWDAGTRLQPTAAGEISVNSKAPTSMRLYAIQQRLQGVLKDLRATCCDDVAIVLELPEKQGGGKGREARGHAAAGYSLVMLSMAAGAELLAARDVLHGSTDVLLKPSQWKGNLPKDITKREAMRVLGHCPACDGLGHDGWDAVALGLYWLFPGYLDGA